MCRWNNDFSWHSPARYWVPIIFILTRRRTFPAFGQQYAYTGNATAKQILVNTANSLCKRFNAIVGCTESWGALNPPDHKFEVCVFVRVW